MAPTAVRRRDSGPLRIARMPATAATLDVVIPAFNEEASLPLVLAEIPRPPVRRVVVADNNSTDRTADVAQQGGAEVVPAPRQGYGSACLAALDHVRRTGPPDIVVFLDADHSDHADEIPLLVAPIIEGHADLVIGSRTLGRVERGALTAPQRFGNWLATRLIRLLHGHRYTDLGPFRAVRRSTLGALGLRDRRFGWTVEMQLRALQVGARVCERPVSYRRRVGRSKISGTVRGVLGAGTGILGTILKLTLRPGGPRGAGPSAS